MCPNSGYILIFHIMPENWLQFTVFSQFNPCALKIKKSLKAPALIFSGLCRNIKETKSYIQEDGL